MNGDRARPSQAQDVIREKAFATCIINCEHPECDGSFDTFDSDPPRDPMDSWSVGFARAARAAGWTTTLAGEILCPEHSEE